MTKAATEPIYYLIGQRLREIRIAQGISQENLASRCGIGRTTLVHLEAGKFQSSVHNIYRLARELKVSAHAIFPERDFEGDESIQDLFREFIAERYGYLFDVSEQESE